MEPSVRKTLADAAARPGLVLVLTGAGISAESGIPTFRGEQGYWNVGSEHYHPQQMATREAFGDMPDEVWRWYLYRRTVCRRAKPNAGHEAVVRLERAFEDRFRLVTQNVDGLHLRTGNTAQRTYQIHGNIDFMRCAQDCCNELWPVPSEIAPKDRDSALTEDDVARLVCPQCGERSRPHVLWFDEYYDETLFRSQSALTAAGKAGLLIVVGTTGTTNLPLQVAAACGRAKAAIIDINPDDNVFAQFARETGGHALAGPAGEFLPAVVDALIEAR